VQPQIPSDNSGPDEISEIQILLNYLPGTIRQHIDRQIFDDLVEIVVDLNRPVQLRFPGDYVLLPHHATQGDLEFIVQRVGLFRSDNRAGIEGTLHRISAIRNRYQDLVGVTMRVGRHLAGVADSLQPTLARGESLLILGPPGSGKTTLLRDLTRIASTDLRRRVVVVDTSNEIGGDGNVPHPAIGTARRIQVPDRADQYRLLLEAVQNHTPEVVIIDEIGTKAEAESADQHRLLLEAVQNHTPEVVIIDEIGTKAEAESAASIAERGVQLIATAHGHRLLNLVKNAELNLLVGGVHTVTHSEATMAVAGIVGARSAGRASTQERIKDPTFNVVVELVPDAERTMRLYDTLAAVDDLLEGNQPTPSYLLSTCITVEALRASFADSSAINVRRFRRQVDWYAELLDDPSTTEG